MQKWHFFGLKNYFQKISCVVFVPQSKLFEKIGPKGPINGFLKSIDVNSKGYVRVNQQKVAR